MTLTRFLTTLFLLFASGCSNAPSAPLEPKPSTLDGKSLFAREKCADCHRSDQTAHLGPGLGGLWGKTVRFTDGTETVRDDGYMHEAILNPRAKICEGFADLMPKPNLSEPEADALVTYLKTL